MSGALVTYRYLLGRPSRLVSVELRSLARQQSRCASRTQHAISKEPLLATVPVHSSYLFLHTDREPPTWPPRLELEDDSLARMKQRMARENGLANLAYIAQSPSDTHATLHKAGSSRSISVIDGELIDQGPSAGVHFYVCTHGNRDCRCGDAGADVVESMRTYVQTTNLEGVQIAEVGHVGGHAWAANVLVFPYGDWYGNIRPGDVPTLIALYTSKKQSPIESSELFKRHWRGRMGLTQDQQRQLYAEHCSVPPGLDQSPTPKNLRITFTTWDGTKVDVMASEGDSLMQIAKSADLPSIEGVCGGKLECATCHVYLPPRANDGETAPVASISEAEDDMLEYAIGRREESRLGCQIPLTDQLLQWVNGGGAINLPKF